MPILVSGRVLGARKPLFADWSIPLSPDDFADGDGLTLRRLITHVVAAELRAFQQRRESRRLDRVLAPAQIDAGAAAGRIAPEARATPAPPTLDEATAIALQAFEDGLYLVAIDGVEFRSLDARVMLSPDSRITFIRLVFLAGA